MRKVKGGVVLNGFDALVLDCIEKINAVVAPVDSRVKPSFLPTIRS